MSTHLKEKEERVQQLLELLMAESGKGIPIIVEGKKDIEALRALNVEGEIISVKTGGRSFLDVLSELEKTRPREVILLLDFDRRGREWTRRLKQHLETARIVPNTTFWSRLSAILGREVKDIEGLTAYLNTLRGKLAIP